MRTKLFIIVGILSILFIGSFTQAVHYYQNYNLVTKQVKQLQIENLKLKIKKQKFDYLNYKNYIFAVKYPVINKIVEAVYVQTKKYPHFSPYMILSLIRVESGFNPAATNKATGCIGLMQINTKVWQKHFNIDISRIYDIEYNIEIGLKILDYYYQKEGKDIYKALFRYNNGYGFNNKKYVPKVLNLVEYK